MGILGDFLPFLIQLPADFHETWQMVDADKVTNPQHYWSDSADTRDGLIRKFLFQ